MTAEKDYPQGYGCISGTWGHFECVLTDDNLDYFSLLLKPPKSEEDERMALLVKELSGVLIKRINEAEQKRFGK